MVHVDRAEVDEIEEDEGKVVGHIGEALVVMSPTSGSNLKSVKLGAKDGCLNMRWLERCDYDKGFGSCVG